MRKLPHNYDTPEFSRIKTMNCVILVLFFRNNSYKLKKVGKTMYKQTKELKAMGYKVDHRAISKLRAGKWFSSTLSYLNFFCVYWNCTLIDMISHDLEEYDRRLAESV